MDSDLNQIVDITLPKSACLLIFELLTSAYEKWRSDNPDDSPASPLQVVADEHATRVALWRLEGELEQALPELFFPNYAELLTEAKRVLATE